jgi:hypothetical protein
MTEDRAGASLSSFSLATAMGWLQDSLVLQLTKGRKHLPHPEEKGDHTELQWSEMLKSFLPRRYSVGKAFVVDVNGACSEQIDVVIYDQHFSPQIFENAGTVYVPAESVYAVFEVRQDLSKANIEYAGQKAASVRRLERTKAEIPHAGGTFAPRDLHRIVAGVLTLGSSWNPPFGQPLQDVLASTAEDDVRLDIGCAASAGSFTVSDDGRIDDLWDRPERAVVWFVTHLLNLLRPIGSVPAIDIVRWTAAALETDG